MVFIYPEDIKYITKKEQKQNKKLFVIKAKQNQVDKFGYYFLSPTAVVVLYQTKLGNIFVNIFIYFTCDWNTCIFHTYAPKVIVSNPDFQGRKKCFLHLENWRSRIFLFSHEF